MTLLPVFIPWAVGLLLGVALGMAYYHDKNKNRPELPRWRKQTGDFIDLGGPEIVTKEIRIGCYGFPYHKIIYNGYEIDFHDLWYSLPKEGDEED